MKKRAKRKNNPIKFLLKAHRYIGLTSFIVLCWLAVSGLLLNHTEELALSHQYTTNKTLLTLYNVPEPVFTKGMKLDGNWLFSVDNSLYFDNKKLLSMTDSRLLGGLSQDEMIIVATEKRILLFTQNNEYIDELKPPATVQKLGLINQRVAIETSDGCLEADQEFTQFTPCDTSSQAVWLTLETVPEKTQSNFLRLQQGSTISLERVVLDTHSGRILGMAGVYFMDGMAILIILLAISGLILWLVRKIKKYRKNNS